MHNSQRFSLLATLKAAFILALSLMHLTTLAQTVQSFTFTGDVQTFVVPTGITTLTIVANGAEGDRGGGSGGGGRGDGGRVTATLTVTPGQLLNLYVGGIPFNGGGAGGVGSALDGDGGAGGGATDIRIGGTALANRVLVAGGGGGGGSCRGSGPTGGFGGDGGGAGGAGRIGSARGDAGVGAGGGIGVGNPGDNNSIGGAGGGGGGGFLGGGGGGIGDGGGGGGGGSGYPISAAGIVTSVVHQNGVNKDNGSMSISYCPPVSRLYVKANATGANTGLSWADAFPDLQSALTYPCSQSLTEIWVAAGTYKPTTGTDRTISFSMLPGVAIYGGFAGITSETALSNRPAINPVSGNPSSTTLSGDIGTPNATADNSYHVIKNPAGLTNIGTPTAAVLDGFVITGGNADGLVFPNNLGGGIYNTGNSSGQVCSPTIRNCLFQDNSAIEGGAMVNFGFSGGSSSPVVTNCAFQGNTASLNGGAMVNNGNSGGGSSSPVLTNCAFQSNSASNGGAIYNTGTFGSSSPVLTNCTFQRNSASIGGAMYNNSSNSGSSNPVLINCAFQGNSASFGGAIFNDGAFSGNSSPVLTNCSFQNNAATNSGGAMFNNGDNGGNSSSTLTNCVLFGNGGSNTFFNNDNNASITATYSLFEPASVTVSGMNVSGPGNLTNVTVSPFASTTSVALAICSPAINAGLNSANTTTIDLAGQPRLVEGRIDMGAIEFQGSTTLAVGITANPSLTVGLGQSTTLTASGGASYSWSSGQSTSAISVSVAGTYSVTGITGSCSGTATTVVGLVPPPVITMQPASASTVCTGASVVVWVGVSGSISGYQWLKGGSPVTNQTSAMLSLGNVQLSDAGIYSLSVTGPGGSTTSSGFTLTVSNFAPTVIITLPNGSTVNVAGNLPTLILPTGNSVLQASGGVQYERLIIVDRVNGYEIRQVDSNTTGIFTINRLGLFTLTVTGAGGCSRTVQGVVEEK